MIVGTAGHIDHGKTALVRALTGVDTDRLPEEKARGITLELGYAYQSRESGGILGFIDVPGHERLVHTMVAGATGIDFVLLVVAADDGPMPQTREHLQVLDLLGLECGAVALTKTDRVSAQRLAEVEADVRGLLSRTGLAAAPLFPVSAVTGEGIADLRTHLHAAVPARSDRIDDRRFRLAVDRAFTLAGTGIVVTGTVHSGHVQPGDQLRLTPSGREARVRGLHAQNEPAEIGVAGQRCALNLAGSELHHTEIRRGEWVVAPDLHLPTRRFDARLRVLPDTDRALRHWTPVHCHLGAAHLTGRVAVLEGDVIEPGGSGLVQLVLDEPIGALRGDRFILRDQSARQTLGGGRVLDPEPPTRGRRRPGRLALLGAFAEPEVTTAVARALPLANEGIGLDRLARHWNLGPSTLAALAALPETVAVGASAGGMLFSVDVWQAWQARILQTLAEEHEKAPERLGPDRERLRRMAAPRLARPEFAALSDNLIRSGRLVRTGPYMHLPGHAVRLSPDAEHLWRERIFPQLDAQPFNPPRVRDLAGALGSDENAIRRLLKQLAGMGEVFQVAHDHFFTRSAIAHMSTLARDLQEREGAARAAAFRDALGIGRKVAIQILEFFDRIGYCRRIGDEHRVFRDSLLDLDAPSTVRPTTDHAR